MTKTSQTENAPDRRALLKGALAGGGAVAASAALPSPGRAAPSTSWRSKPPNNVNRNGDTPYPSQRKSALRPPTIILFF